MSIWANIRDWLGKSVTARDSDSPLYWSDGATAGEAVTSQSALRLSAYWGCVRLITQIVATMPLGIYEKDPKTGSRIARDDHPLARLLKITPNASQTALEFWEGRVLGLCTQGNSFAEKVFLGSKLVALESLPVETYVKRLTNGALEYHYYDRGKEYVLPEDRVFHIRGFGSGGSADNYCGLSPVSYARQTLGISMATERAVADVYARGMRAKGFFTAPALLTPEQRAQAQETLVKPFSGPGAKDWGVLEAGFDMKLVNINPRDAEMILNRQFNVEDICRWFGVPPIMVGHANQGTTMWGTGVEQIVLGFYKTGLIPYLERIEQRIKKDLMTAAEQNDGLYAEFNAEGLLRGDSAARGELYAKLIQNGVMQPAEAREKENLAFVPGSDKLLINSTLMPLDMAGRVAPTPPRAPAGETP